MAKHHIYLDNCCFNRPYDDQNQIRIKIETEAKLYIQSEVKSGEIYLTWSYVLSYENSLNKDELKRYSIDLWEGSSFNTTEPNEKIDEYAIEIMTYGIKDIDALHLACAIHAKCVFFITTDFGILKKRNRINEIKIVSQPEFVETIFGEKNDD